MAPTHNLVHVRGTATSLSRPLDTLTGYKD